MIIKSMARKKPSFEQLISYMQKDEGKTVLFHNLYTHDQTKKEDLIRAFDENARILPKRKNGNYLYHEIISFERNNVEEHRLHDALNDIASLYLSERAKYNLGYCVAHHDTNNIHLHFCISANELGGHTRTRLSKAQFATLQKNLENYVLQKYPELEQSKIYTQEKDTEVLKTSSREQEFKNRSKRASYKEELKTKLHGIFEQAQTHEQLIALLQDAGLDLYTRGKAVGIIDRSKKNRRHRLKTLGLLPHYEATNTRLESVYIQETEPPPKEEPQPVKEPEIETAKTAQFKVKTQPKQPAQEQESVKKPQFKTKDVPKAEEHEPAPEEQPFKTPIFKEYRHSVFGLEESETYKVGRNPQPKRVVEIKHKYPKQDKEQDTEKKPSLWQKLKSVVTPAKSKPQPPPKKQQSAAPHKPVKRKQKQKQAPVKNERLDDLDRISKQQNQNKDRNK